MDAWEDDFGAGPSQTQGGAADPIVDNEYARIQKRYTDAGYREGITDGKLVTLQEGFDSAFAASVPRARRIGQLRGRANALLAILSAPAHRSARATSSAASIDATETQAAATTETLAAVRELVGELARVRRDNVLAPDLERLAHERDEHGEEHAFELDVTESREMEGLEDTLGRMGSAHTQTTQRNGGLREEALLDALESRLAALESQVGLVV